MADRRRPRQASSPRHAARLAATQALYRIELSDAAPEEVLAELGDDQTAGGMLDDDRVVVADTGLLRQLVAGTAARGAELDRLIGDALAENWTLDRIEVLLRVILRAGTFELLACPETPARVVVSEHVAVARAFFDDPETGFANGVLDRLARRLRPDEMGEAGDAATRPAG